MSALADFPLLTAEFLAVDTETNGLARDACEMTEVGCVLVGGGELHDRWGSLVGVSRPLSRGIQRFTGISQAMADAAPPPERVLPELAAQLRGRVLVAHSARFDARVLRQAFDRAALDWPDPPVLCTVALARRVAPLQRRRGLGALADALGIEVEGVHRALPDAETCARVFVFRDADGRPLYVGKSVCLRTRARAHFTTPGEWTGKAEHVDYQPTHSELGALVLENRLIKALRPPGNKRLKKTPDGYVYLRCRLDISFPILEVGREPAAGHSVTIGPLRGQAAAAELVEQLNSLFSLRHCGRKLPRRDHPSAYGQMGRCLSPCLQDLDPNLYRERLDSALGLFQGPDGGASLLAHIEALMRTASAEQRFERAAWLRRRHARLRTLLERLGGVLRAIHAGSRLVLAAHPTDAARCDAFWIVGGRVVDWGALPEDPDELAARTADALRAAPRPELGGWLRPDEIAEARIVGLWLAAHDARVHELTPGTDPGVLAERLSGPSARAA